MRWHVLAFFPWAVGGVGGVNEMIQEAEHKARTFAILHYTAFYSTLVSNASFAFRILLPLEMGLIEVYGLSATLVESVFIVLWHEYSPFLVSSS
jgi:hypothetical protein